MVTLTNLEWGMVGVLAVPALAILAWIWLVRNEMKIEKQKKFD
jgi:hypothetical protein